MSNNKQSRVTELYNKMMQYVPIEYHYLVKEEIPLEQYEAMHKEEIINAHTIGYVIGGGNGYIHEPEQYYNETFGGNNE